jgi:sugar phosphate isomerase/epimerase
MAAWKLWRRAINFHMQRMISSHVVVNHRLTTSWLSKIEAAGIAGVEIFCAIQHIDWRNKQQVAELGHFFRDSELKLHSVHSPMYTDEIWGRSGPDSHINITLRNKPDRIRWVDEIKRALEIAEVAPFRYMIQHLGDKDQQFSEEAFEAAYNSLDELCMFAHQRGVEVLLENIPNDLSTASRLRYFNEFTHLNMNFVFDTGHAHIGAGVEHEFNIMRDRVRSLHVHDNDGANDIHLFPGAEGGTINWPNVMEMLRARPGQYPLMLELKEVAGMQHPIQEILGVFDHLEAPSSAQLATPADAVRS